LLPLQQHSFLEILSCLIVRHRAALIRAYSREPAAQEDWSKAYAAVGLKWHCHMFDGAFARGMSVGRKAIVETELEGPASESPADEADRRDQKIKDQSQNDPGLDGPEDLSEPDPESEEAAKKIYH